MEREYIALLLCYANDLLQHSNVSLIGLTSAEISRAEFASDDEPDKMRVLNRYP